MSLFSLERKATTWCIYPGGYGMGESAVHETPADQIQALCNRISSTAVFVNQGSSSIMSKATHNLDVTSSYYVKALDRDSSICKSQVMTMQRNYFNIKSNIQSSPMSIPTQEEVHVS